MHVAGWLTRGSLLFAVALASACSGGAVTLRTEGNYCTEVGNRLADLEATTFARPEDVTRVLDSWAAVSAAAPLAVQPEWEQVVAAMQLAAEVNPSDADAVQTMADTLREAQPAADRIITYTYRVCGAAIGGVPPVSTAPLQLPPSTSVSASTPASTGG